jgi:endonuclease/exonuclease/phosphatase (EEP) superfamily protein YafD
MDRHDRIDFVFVRGATVKTVEVVGESKDRADVVVSPYPSDHRAMVAEVEVPDAK